MPQRRFPAIFFVSLRIKRRLRTAARALTAEHVDPSRREKTDSTSSDPEEHVTSTNLVVRPGVEGQEQSERAFCRHNSEEPGLDGGDREDGRPKESRSVNGGEQDFLTTEEYQEDLRIEFEESVATTVAHLEQEEHASQLQTNLIYL
ncbi:hypothetical protein NDU88_004982 [Pleurodeles waltl]|uniref:Uncharacterized protein n=1 Tax=Pleurodeles waltl TaxID=8319 RepID=A0AAV7LLI1_PLEWA|nr:hypothetical protein NDU88_004982 [Pleurodeles waltl]